MKNIPTVAIVGRPNVGKSTLFNRIVGKRDAIVAHEAGTTRDRLSRKTSINGLDVVLIDTGGIESGKKENIEEDIYLQSEIAISGADLTIFVVDGVNPLTVDDYTAADMLRKSDCPVILVANKCDNPEVEKNIFSLYELGFGDPVKISAIHKIGMDELFKVVKKQLLVDGFEILDGNVENSNGNVINLCLLGRPNAGKSSMVNALTGGSSNIIVSNVAGTTRDAIDTLLEYEDSVFNLIDTAGLRRPGKRNVGIEKFSVLRAFSAIERSDVVVLMIDGLDRISAQDTHIAQRVLEAEKGLIIVVNKIDCFEAGEEMRERVLRQITRKFIFVPWVSIVFVSAKNKTNTYRVLKVAKDIVAERKKRIQTSELNVFLKKITFKHLPASTKIKKPRFMYGNQAAISPPKFVLFFKNPTHLHFTYPRYLENKIREEYGFNGTPINITIKHTNDAEDRSRPHSRKNLVK